MSWLVSALADVRGSSGYLCEFGIGCPPCCDTERKIATAYPVNLSKVEMLVVSKLSSLCHGGGFCVLEPWEREVIGPTMFSLQEADCVDLCELVSSPVSEQKPLILNQFSDHIFERGALL